MEAADISGCFGRYGFIAHNWKADTPELSRDLHPAQPVDSTTLSTVMAMFAFRQSEHCDRLKEAQNERGCHQRQCSHSTHLFIHLREAMNHPKGLCQNLS